MEAFSLLKYWRAGGGAGGTTTTVPDSITNAKAATKTIVAAAAVSPYSSDGEDGPYFDLEFALPDQESDTDEQTSAESQENDVKREDEDETESEEEISVHHSDEDDDDDEEEAELKFSLTNNECTDQNAALSPSDDLFFKGDLVSIEPSGILLNTAEENSKFPIFLVKSATKFRVLLLKLKKSKSVNGENTETAEKPETAGQASPTPTPPKAVERESQGKLSGKFFVKFKVEEVPLVNLFTRDNSSKENHGKAPKQSVQDSDTNSASDERKLSKEVVHKYLKMVKPFYIRVSKRYVEKLKFPGHSGGGSKGVCAAAPPAEATAINVKSSHPKPGNNLQAGLKVVRKHLGKSRSASAAAAPPPAKVVSDRRDDSLLQLQDGIQGAILHCKKSFNAARDVESQSSILCRSVSDPSYSYEKSIMKPKFSRAPSSISGEAKKGIS